MFEAIIITLREGVEAALVLAIALAFIRRRNRPDLIGPLFAGTAAALMASVLLSVVLGHLPFNEELTEGIAMLVGALLVFSLVAFMWRAAPHMKQEVETAVERAAAAGVGAAAMFLFAFGLILREGLETALFLSAARFNTDGLGMWIGALIGLAAAVGFGVLFTRGMIRVPLKPFFTVTSAVLVLLGVQLLVGGLHELSEGEVIPSSRAEMAILGPVVKNELLLFTLTIAVVAGWLLFARSDDAGGAGGGAAALRLARANQARDVRRRRWTGVLGLVVVAVLTTAFVRGARVPEQQPAEPLVPQNGAVRFDVNAVSDGHVHFYQTSIDSDVVRFFAILVNGEIRTCFDGCAICGDIGYFESGSKIVCRNCVSPIAPTSLGRAGGCNPIPLPSHVDGGRVVVTEADLRAGLPEMKGR